MANLSKDKRDRLINFIENLKLQHSDNESLIALNEIENELTNKKYGLIWESHEERVDTEAKENVPVFKEIIDKQLKKLPENKFDFLLEGDNLHSLKLLEKTHKERIDLIYIDPPYNTGNQDFFYLDSYVGEDDDYRHSKWLSFMSERLEMARRLLTPEGVIFIQISDIEVAQLKLLCDEIFDESNFLNIISVNMKNIAGASGGGEDKKFKKNCEYILVYAKNYATLPLFNGAYVYTEMSELIQSYIDNGVSWKYTSVLVEEGEKEYIGSTVDGDGNDIKVYRRINPKSMSVKQVAKADGISEQEAYKKYGTRVFRTTNAQSSIRTRVMAYRKETNITDDIISIEYVPKTGKNKGKIYEQFYKGDKCNLFVWLRDTSEVIDGLLYKKDLQGTYWDATAGTKNLTKEGNIEFANGKKPVDLIKQIIKLYPSKDITVLDFFAGSGTTGHAVIALNAEEEGSNRKFILCTNNENNICEEKTYPRLYNVINGYTTDKGKVFEPVPSNLKYYKADKIPKVSSDPSYSVGKSLLSHIKEMIQLEHGINVDDDKYIMVLTSQDADELERNKERLTNCQTIYISNRVLLSGEQKKLLKGIKQITVPDYYFEEELREVGER